MTVPTESVEPWRELAHRLQGGGDVTEFLASLRGSETVLAISRLPEELRTQLFTDLQPEEAADLVEQLPHVSATDIVEHLDPQCAARIVHELASDEQADLIGDLDKEDAEAILSRLEPDEAHEVRTLAAYGDDEAGGLMVTEYLAYPSDAKVSAVIDDLRENRDEYADYDIQYAYVVADDKLVGVIPVRNLLWSRADASVGDVMIRNPYSVDHHTSVAELQEFFDEHQILGVPVVDDASRLLGVVQASDLDDAIVERSDNDYRSTQGIVGGEELRTMPIAVRSRRRLAWLSLNIVLNLVAASVISAFEDTLQAVITLAVFLPIISDMSGCSGNQAVAVSIRELSLGYVRPKELGRVWAKEIVIGTINGAVLGTLIAFVAWLWKGNVVLGAVIGAAMMLNTMVAVSIGGLVPLILKRFNKDPALASGPILTTVTDMCGFLTVLGFASLVLDHLR